MIMVIYFKAMFLSKLNNCWNVRFFQILQVSLRRGTTSLHFFYYIFFFHFQYVFAFNCPAATVAMAEENADFVMGFISVRRVTDDPRFIHMTPG